MDTDKKPLLVITETFVNCRPEDFEDQDPDDVYVPDPEWRRNGNTYELRKFLGEF